MSADVTPGEGKWSGRERDVWCGVKSVMGTCRQGIIETTRGFCSPAGSCWLGEKVLARRTPPGGPLLLPVKGIQFTYLSNLECSSHPLSHTTQNKQNRTSQTHKDTRLKTCKCKKDAQERAANKEAHLWCCKKKQPKTHYGRKS